VSEKLHDRLMKRKNYNASDSAESVVRLSSSLGLSINRQMSPLS